MKFNLVRKDYLEWEEYFLKISSKNHIKTDTTYFKNLHKQVPIDLSNEHISNLLSQQLRSLSFD